MWLFTTNGFYSVVHNRDGGMLIRGRQVGHLNALCDWMEWPRSRVIETPANDYRFRILATHEEWEKVAARLAGEPSQYENFKGECGRVARYGDLDSAYVKTLSKVWRTMHDYQQANI